MELPLLETKCENCLGRGYQYGSGKCRDCHGSGMEPTEAGKELLDFMHRHRPAILGIDD